MPPAQDHPDHDSRRGGRPAAGTDPRKRRQILDGASRVFTTLGFDAASMSDIAREADVSKATLYVYFSSKEQLFAAICAEHRDRNILALVAVLDRQRPMEQVLFDFGVESLRRLLKPYVLPAHRVVIGVAERMPEIGRELFATGPKRLCDELTAYLVFHAEAGRLDLDDAELAAAQFLELSQATVFRRRIYTSDTSEIDEQRLLHLVGSAVRVFLSAYGTGKTPMPA